MSRSEATSTAGRPSVGGRVAAGPDWVSPSVSDEPSPGGSGSVPAFPAPEGTRLTSPGGVAYARCVDGQAMLTAWEPAAGYAVERVDPGPALTASVVFTGRNRYRTAVTCVAGRPTPVVLPL